jgi:hypothetical protein
MGNDQLTSKSVQRRLAVQMAEPKDNCSMCKGERGVLGNGNIINGIVLCDYCHSDPIKLCPFCGGNFVLDKTLREGYENMKGDPEAYAHFLRCVSCAATGGWAKTASGAIRWWNMRHKVVMASTDPKDP